MAERAGKLKSLRLGTKPARQELAALEIGNIVYLDGVVYTGREGVYRRAVEEGKPLPVSDDFVGTIVCLAVAPHDRRPRAFINLVEIGGDLGVLTLKQAVAIQVAFDEII